MSERRFITVDEAVNLLPDGENIHTFENGGMVLLGCDWNRDSIIKNFNEYKDTLELSGATARGMGHGIAFIYDEYPLFVETDDIKLNEFDPIPDETT